MHSIYEIVSPGIDSRFGIAHAEVWQQLGACGTWWTGNERIKVMKEARAAHSCELCAQRKQDLTPTAASGSHSAVSDLPEEAVDLIHRVVTDPGRLTRNWAEEIMESIGEEHYVELVTVICTQNVIEEFTVALGVPLPNFPDAGEGTPRRTRPDGVGDVGAWVSQSIDKPLANVSRCVSLVPDSAQHWRCIVDEHYSHGREFGDLVWERPLSRPQVELIASVVSSLNECFY